jgi:proline iminopeptidase
LAARSPTTSDILYPPFPPYRQGYLKVGGGKHTLYFEESGNPKGRPAVVLHGGPGGGTQPRMRRFFNPAKYRIVLFDQRGCGKSRPHASLIDNTTWDLVADIETLRRHLGIDRWLVFGGSWGSTLGLAYAETYPQRVTALVLRGIFLMRKAEIDWFYQNRWGAAAIYPDRWEEYESLIPARERRDMVRAYYRRLTSPERRIRSRAARAWAIWEAATSYLKENNRHVSNFRHGRAPDAISRIECHYFVNRGFLRRDDELLRGAKRIRRIPGVIVQGRYDIVCPIRSAWDLHRAWPKADLRIVGNAGHSGFELGTARELVRATDRLAAI